ncbi:MAG: carboxypeptidase-like regulatory domain-containing protein [Verrucomicrobia bacterium]|nr:carboxypeptidase-like regulatory domain-containing protein [Verrucomicrobiota bacterium]
MHPLLRLRSVLLCASLAAASTFSALTAATPSPATGTVEGRILNARSGEYLEGARVTVPGTNLETFTETDGSFLLANVPAGTVRVTAFYTGLPPQTKPAVVPAGGTTTVDFSLSTAGARADDAVVKLDEFRVETSREMDGAALAINEQRFASNIKTVVSTDDFGNVAEGNVAEFIKFLPGINIDYTGGNARDISINGVPSDFVPVTVDGFNVAAAAGRETNRQVQSDMISINNLSRIEVTYAPTPESQGAALAGSVNMVPRSAFERVRPVFNASAYLLMRDNARDFRKVPGPDPSPMRNVHPGFDFSWVAPVNKRFGYTLSGGVSTNYSPQDQVTMTWRGTSAATNGAAFPHTTFDRPYLSQFLVQDAPKVTTRRSFGASVDFKFTPHDRVTFGFQYSSFDGHFLVSNVQFNPLRILPGDFSTTFTHGAAGAGDVIRAHNERNRYNRTYMPTLVWRHEGPVWKADLGAGLSQQSDYNRDIEQGYFRTVQIRRTGLTVAFDDIFYLRPATITVRDGAGAPLDPFQLAPFALTQATSQRDATHDWQRTAYGSLRRDFGTRIPLSLKAGFHVRESVRDITGGTITYAYVGPDGRASTTPIGSDDSAAPFFDPIYSERVLPMGFPKVQTVSARKVWEHYVAHPSYFTINENTSYRTLATNSKRASELVSALYLRGDAAFFERRLKLVGGLRAEQTNAEADGPLTDPSRNVQRDAQGRPILGPNGRPLPIVANTNSLEYSRLTLLERAAHTEKEYLRLFPNLNASYNLRDNLIARASYYESVGRPNFNQYAGGLTLPDLDSPPANNNRITVNNAGIKAWQARTVAVRLEHYFEGVGQFAVGAFRRQVENFFGSVVFNATPEFLALYGLDPATYDPYDVSTNHNIPGSVRMEGWNFNYRQALTFLPRWARGVQVFANGSAQRILADDDANFAGYVPRSGSWGISVTREKWNARVNWNYRGRQRQAPVAAGASIEPGTFTWGSKRLYVDVLGEYYFHRRLAAFFNLRNAFDATEDVERAGPSTPAHAQFFRRIDYASLWTFGVKGTW